MRQQTLEDGREEFLKAYSKLNSAQKEAVDSIEGPVIVVAGPGTGKTQILTLRIANILIKTDVTPENILALTFTESGARAMRERLRFFIGSDAYRVRIQTFHGFAGELIRSYPDAYPKIVGGKPISVIEKVEVLEQILASEEIKLLRPAGNPGFYLKPIISVLSTLKQEYISPDQLAAKISIQENELATLPKFHEKGAHKGKVRGEYHKKEQSIDKNKELLKVYRLYQANLQERQLYDFEDMISESVRALSENIDMLRDLQETFQYLLADEHQDVNGAQNNLLELLADFHEAPNLFVVGDEKQAIYRFQGASVENFLYFEKKYPNTKVISLIDNYRSAQEILDLSHSLIEIDSGPVSELRIPLVSCTETSAEISNRHFTHRAVENEWLANSIKQQLKQGVPASEVAVIVRNNYEVESLSQYLRKYQLTVSSSAEGDVLRHPVANSFIDLIKVAADRTDEESLFKLLHAPYWGISTNDLFKLLRGRGYWLSLSELINDEEKLQSLGLDNQEVVSKVAGLLREVNDLTTSKALPFVVEYLLRESGLLNHLLKGDKLESVRVVRRLYDEVDLLWQQGITSLHSLSKQLRKYQELGLALNAPFLTTSSEAVQVMTAHKSKGLEFEFVYLPHLVDQVWGVKNTRQYFKIDFGSIPDALDEMDDERRLLYVAMTRAKSKLFFSSSATDETGRDFLESRFMAEVQSSLVKLEGTEVEEKEFAPETDLLSEERSVKLDSELLKSHLLERGLSATSLNNYLTSPWDYLYRNVLQIPEMKGLPLLYGTALHNVLQRFTRQYAAQGSFLDTGQVSNILRQELERVPITATEFANLHEKGLESLLVYLEHVKKVVPQTTTEELKLRVVMPTGWEEFPEVTLTGMLDRVDFSEDGSWLRVVDYKTGKPKTRNEIEGKTKSSNGNYKRQLVFYALMASLLDDERSIGGEYILSFVEPDRNGQIKEETFMVSDQEIKELQGQIVDMVKAIVSGYMLQEPCDPNQSEYCELVKLLQ